MTQNATTGAITLSAPYTKRTPWYTDTDFNFKQTYKVGETKALSFDATFSNVLNQHSVVANWENSNSVYTGNNFITANGQAIFNGLDFYSAALGKYDYVGAMNNGALNGTGTGPITASSLYKQPYEYQLSRNVILGVHFTF